jgi:phosphomannomutase
MFFMAKCQNNMEVAAHIFKKNDIRGLLAEVTPEIAKQTAMAMVAITDAKKVVVGRDMRSTSEELAKAAIEGALLMGVDVVDIGLCTTSMFNFAVSSQIDVDAGLMVTASHNPAEYNGIKVAWSNGLPIPGTDFLPLMDEIYEPAEKRGLPAGRGQEVGNREFVDEYLDFCLAGVDEKSFAGTKVVIDYGNGMGALSVRRLCSRLRLEVIELYAEPDARFPNHEANPAKEETLAAVKAAVIRERADFGIALDGDADRVAFIDNEGVNLRGDQTLALLAEVALQKNPGAKVIVAPNQSWAMHDVIKQAGGECVEVAVGRTTVIRAMYDSGAILGGELSSHFMFAEAHNLESVDLAIVKILQLWKASGMLFADLARPLRVMMNSSEVNIEVEDKVVALARIEEKFVATATLVNRLDGIRCEHGRDWWFLVRASNTEPILRLIVEAKTEELMVAKRDELTALIKA